MKESKLFCKLPEYICTPDSMAIDKFGNLILSCPNFANEQMSGCVVKITPDGVITKWFDVPVHPETKVARNMGITFDEDWNVYLCDNQGWSEKEELLYKGRILKVMVDDEGTISECITIAHNMEHPNGIRIKDGYMYVTQSYMHPATKEGELLISGVYRFSLDEQNVKINNDLTDKNLFATFTTKNLDCQYGVDGIVFDTKGDLYIGNFGDGEVFKIILNVDGSIKEQVSFAKNSQELSTTDGMDFDKEGNLYIADFSKNAIVKVTSDGIVKQLAQSEDCTGLEGGLDQPGEPIIWNNKVIVSCFDLVTGPDKVNTEHELPATLAYIDLE